MVCGVRLLLVSNNENAHFYDKVCASKQEVVGSKFLLIPTYNT